MSTQRVIKDNERTYLLNAGKLCWECEAWIGDGGNHAVYEFADKDEKPYAKVPLKLCDTCREKSRGE